MQINPIGLSDELLASLGMQLHEITPNWLTIPEGYEIAPIFPFNGAFYRFRIRKAGSNNHVSVYFDINEGLGWHDDKPYYEAYPIGDDAECFSVGEEKQLMDAIVKEPEKCR